MIPIPIIIGVIVVLLLSKGDFKEENKKRELQSIDYYIEENKERKPQSLDFYITKDPPTNIKTPHSED